MARNDMHIGKMIWAFAAGHIPLLSNGKEPAFTSHDKIAILNTSLQELAIKITIFYEDQEPIVCRDVSVGARRIRKIRFNDLIDPLPIPLDKPFGFKIESNCEVVVQFSRAITSSKCAATFCVTPYFN